MRKRAVRAMTVAMLVMGTIAGGSTAALADAPDPYCDTVLPVLTKLGYNGEDPRCH